MTSCCCGFFSRSRQRQKIDSGNAPEQVPLLAKSLDKGSCSDKPGQPPTSKVEPVQDAFLPDTSELDSKVTIRPATNELPVEANDPIAQVSASNGKLEPVQQAFLPDTSELDSKLTIRPATNGLPVEANDASAQVSASNGDQSTGSGSLKAVLKEPLRDSPSTLALVSSARMKMQSEDFEGAVVDFNNAISLLKDDERQSPSTAYYFVELGNALNQLGDTESALASLKEAFTIREITGTLDTQEGADLLQTMGVLQSESLDVDSAISSYTESRRIREVIGTLQSTDGASLLSTLGMAMSEVGDTDGALDSFREARSIYEQLGRLETSECASLLLTMGVLQSQSGDLEGACETLLDCWHIYEATGRKEDPDAIMCFQMLENVGAIAEI